MYMLRPAWNRIFFNFPVEDQRHGFQVEAGWDWIADSCRHWKGVQHTVLFYRLGNSDSERGTDLSVVTSRLDQNEE